MKHFDKVMWFCFLGTLLVFTAHFCQQKTDGFTILAISPSKPHFSSLEGTPLVHPALDKPYSYFGCGGQSFVFFSNDGQYVLKFFKQRRFSPRWFTNLLPFPAYRQLCNAKKAQKKARDYWSYKLASEELQELTGVVYTHFGPTAHLQKKLEIIDRLGIHHWIDLDHFDFLIQRRAEKVYDRIERLMAAGNFLEAKETVKAVFQLIEMQAQKGFLDRDPNIGTNCGFLEGRGILIDVGKLVPCSAQTEEGDKAAVLLPFKEWIALRHPSLIETFNALLEKIQ